MPNYRRNFVPGGTYFFTVVTFARCPRFADPHHRSRLRRAIETVQANYPFTAFATVLLPDHLHTVWMLPPGDDRYSTRWRRIKEEFTEKFLASDGAEGPRSASRRRHGERAVWQRRFWEHTVRDADDLRRCVDYVHWNPVKHGYVRRPGEWAWSTFARFVASGDYPTNWGEDGPVTDVEGAEWE